MKTKPAPFKPGQRVRCTDPVPGQLKLGGVYTVIDLADLGPPTALITLVELPGVLFHPNRFVRVSRMDERP